MQKIKDLIIKERAKLGLTDKLNIDELFQDKFRFVPSLASLCIFANTRGIVIPWSQERANIRDYEEGLRRNTEHGW